MNVNDAKINMIKQQIQTYEVIDAQVLQVFESIDRGRFVMPGDEDLAYADMMLPINEGQYMLSPKDQGKILQALEIKSHERVLEVGTGNGFLTALLSRLAKTVTSVEIHEALSIEAAAHLQRLHISNVQLQVGNAAQGWTLEAPVDILVITGGLPVLPNAFKSCIKDNGRVIAILGMPPAMQVMHIQRRGEAYTARTIFETEVPMLEKAFYPEQFVF